MGVLMLAAACHAESTMLPAADSEAAGEASAEVDATGGMLASLVATQLAIAAFGWAQTILSLNRFRGLRRITHAEWYALAINMGSAAVRVVASLAAASASFALQLTAATVGSLLSWTAFLLIYNDEVRLPSWQQTQSIALGLVSTAMWELNGRIIVSLTRGDAA